MKLFRYFGRLRHTQSIVAQILNVRLIDEVVIDQLYQNEDPIFRRYPIKLLG